MVVAFVDDGVDVAVVGTALGGVGGDVGHCVGDFEPAAVNVVDVDGVDDSADAVVDVNEDDFEDVTDAVGLLDEDLVAGKEDVVDDAVSRGEFVFCGNVKDIALFDVVYLQVDGGVVSAGFGVFDIDNVRVRLFAGEWLLSAGARAVVLDGIFGDASLVGAQEGEEFTIFRPPGCAVAGEDFLFVHPVGDAVEVFWSTVTRDLDQLLALAGDAAHKHVVISGEGDGIALGTPGGKLDPGAVVERHKRLGGLGLDVEDEVDGCEGVAPVLLLLDCQEDLFQVRAGLEPCWVVVVPVVEERRLLHERACLCELGRGILGSLAAAHVFHDEVVLPSSSPFKQKTVLAVWTGNPAN